MTSTLSLLLVCHLLLHCVFLLLPTRGQEEHVTAFRWGEAAEDLAEDAVLHLPFSALPPHVLAGVDAVVVEDTVNLTSSPLHSFMPMQSSGVFAMERMTAQAPWSARIQPALLYQQAAITYRHWQSNVQVSTGEDWLLFFEGSLTRSTADPNLANENDVWASMDGGQTWDLVAGVSLYGSSGRVESRIPNTFPGRGGSNNCEDPASDRIFSVAGYRTNFTGGVLRRLTNGNVYTSLTAKTWQTMTNAFQPGRYFSSCDVDINGHVFSMGGITVDPVTNIGSLLNDVWHTAAGGPGWLRITAAAPWSARAEHLTLIASDTPLGKEVIYVMGGMVTWVNNGAQTTQSNDVWMSSDNGETWANIVANNAVGMWPKRWGHGGVVTRDGVIIIFGGSNSDTPVLPTYSYRDVWSSFDGGYTWRSCQLPSGPDAARQFIRTEQGVTINKAGQMIVASGYSFDGAGGRFDYRDVWRTPFSVEDTQLLASMCGGESVIPRVGVGLRQWPRSTNPSPTTTMIMHAMSHRAPWSPRIQPAALVMSRPATYTQVKTGLTVSTPPSWLLLYEGGLTTNGINENDVWASADNGKTWDLISGITRFGSGGLQLASKSAHAFSGRSASSNCEDPTNDDVYSLAGQPPGEPGSNVVWYSTDSVTWSLQTGLHSFHPGRYFASCDVDDHGNVYVLGGIVPNTPGQAVTAPNKLLNDVWVGSNKGRFWRRVDPDPMEVDVDSVPEHWSPRGEHAVLLYHSPVLKTDLLYVMGGYTLYDTRAPNRRATVADVWVSSDGGYSWVELTGAGTEEGQTSNMWSKRWGHAAVITEKGVLVVAGGADTRSGLYSDMVSHRDMWASFDGGFQWHRCRLPSNPGFIRTEQSAALTEDEHLLLLSGYLFSNNSRRTDFSDVFISNISLSDPIALAHICGGEEALPSRGVVGLTKWPKTAAVVEPGPSGMSGVARAAIGFVIVLVVAVLGYCLHGYDKTGRFPLPAFCGGGAPAYQGRVIVDTFDTLKTSDTNGESAEPYKGIIT